jgi:fatty-acyl-CoA synthase
MNTGDIFSMDKRGVLYFKSRSKEIITAKGSGRLDVYPSVVENCLLKHPCVIEAAVFGVSVNTFEQELCAWVKLKDEAMTSDHELIKHCEKNLIDYQVPRYIKFVDHFPTTKLGKYARNQMSKQYKKELNEKSVY